MPNWGNLRIELGTTCTLSEDHITIFEKTFELLELVLFGWLGFWAISKNHNYSFLSTLYLPSMQSANKDACLLSLPLFIINFGSSGVINTEL